MSDDFPTLSDLKDLYDECFQEYESSFERARILDGTDRGNMWDVIGAEFPKYQILPNTNHVAFVKNNILANIYTVGRAASLEPTSKGDKDIVQKLNIAIEYAWERGMISYYQMKAGERAALLNKGITKVGWDNSVTGGKGNNFYKGEPVLKNISPLNYMRDPYVDEIHDAEYAFTWDYMHKNVLKRDKDYEENFKKYLDDGGSGGSSTIRENQTNTPRPNNNKDYFKVIQSFVFDDEGKLWEIHSIDFEHVLLKRERKPAVLPFSELYCNLPNDDPLGVSEPAKIYSNSVAYNLMNSFGLTAGYKNQRPPRYLNENSGIDLPAFREHGNEADHTFVVNGDASRAVHYHEFPELSPQILSIIGGLGQDIQQITGVDGRYTGRDTGSVTTTGGMDQMLDQVSMIDQPKIVNYEKYSKRLSQLVLKNMLEFGQKRKYFYKSENATTPTEFEVDFPDIDSDTLFKYSIQISPILPKSKQRTAQMANILMEKQMQYAAQGQQGVDLITPEEWLMFQDLPNKEYMLERMDIQRNQDFVEEVSKIVTTYSDLVQKGVKATDAMVQTARAVKEGQEMRKDPRQKSPDFRTSTNRGPTRPQQGNPFSG